MSVNRLPLKKLLISRIFIFTIITLIILFLPAGTLAYWQAWMYLLSLLIPAGFVLRYFYQHDPDFLARRMRFQEHRPSQKKIINWGNLVILLAYFIPGFDHRWQWSQVPLWLIIMAQALVLLGYGLIIRVFLENRYASRIVEVSQDQKLIHSGPYTVIRHPMYAGAICFYVVSPLTLGSYWAIIPAALIIPILVLRILDEEALLKRELPGYSEYAQEVRYRLIPYIW